MKEIKETLKDIIITDKEDRFLEGMCFGIAMAFGAVLIISRIFDLIKTLAILFTEN